ncbi:MAG: hypothetical protein WC531_02770 [Candidatus Paceibacterota bacterium]|jgi:hypothetical protein
MELLNGLLAHYRQLFKDKQQEIDLILVIIKKQTNLTLTSDEIKLKEGVLFIKTKPKSKLELILQKPALLEQLNNQGIKVVDFK